MICYNQRWPTSNNIMMDFFNTELTADSILIECVTQKEYEKLHSQSDSYKGRWLNSTDHNISTGQHQLIPNSEGKLDSILFVVDEHTSMWDIAHLSHTLPTGNYHLSEQLDDDTQAKLALGWGLGAYQYTRYKKAQDRAQLYLSPNLNTERIHADIETTFLTRELINAPANEMLPSDLAAATEKLANQYHADFEQICGQALIEENYPLIHAVGRASTDQPRYLKLRWGNPKHPRLALIGKGVCFDSGGLDIKPSSGMRWMKKDMGGAAHALGCARYIMMMNLPVYLELAIPAVENAIAGNAFRPGDVIISRSGKSVEIDNTDAEGRLVMADAISDLCSNQPDCLIDFSTLTGAARVALGTEVGVYFTNNDELAEQLQTAAEDTEDDIWRLPIHQGYKHMLKSSIADLVNCTASGYGGAITAALFLQEFLSEDCDWLHFDIMAYNMRTRPGRPKGGEAMGLRAVCELLERKYRNNAS